MVRQRKKDGTSIQQQLKRLEVLLKHLPIGVLGLDAARRLIFANPTAQEYLPVLTKTTLGTELTHLGKRSVEEFLALSPAGEGHEVIVDGPPRQILAVSARAIAKEPDVGGWVLVVRDITAERIVQEQRQQQEHLAAVRQLTTGIAHDFTNILMVIIGFADLLHTDPTLSDDVRAKLDLIAQQGQRASHLIRQILDFSQQAIAERHPLNLVPFLNESVESLERTFPDSITVSTEFSPEEHVVQANPTQLQQMLTHLVANARDAMPEGGELRIQLSHRSVSPGERPPVAMMPPGEWMVLSVSDTGTGMPPEVLQRVFEPFFTTKEVGKGRGLGLSQVYGLVKQHDGFIDVTSAVGQGTTVTIYLPTLTVQQEVAQQEVPEGKTQEVIAQRPGETILLVDDEPAVLETTIALLEHLGYYILPAHSGEEALHVYSQHREEIALVLTDMGMPGMGGRGLCHALCQQGSPVPIIVLSGHPMEGRWQDWKAEGIVDWLQKPVNLEQLAQAIRQALSPKSP